MQNRSQNLKLEYQNRFQGKSEYRKKVWHFLCADFFSRYIPQNSRILDLGAGWGEFINNISAGKKFAMDLNPDTHEHLSADVAFLHQDCSQAWQMDSESLDVVFTSNFLEHISDRNSVEATISEAYRCLKPSGIIIALGPNIKYLPGTYWDFWDHHIPLTDSSVSELFVMNGFRIELSIPRFLPYTMSTGRTPPIFFLRLYLRLPLLWPIFGKQFLIIGRKTEKVLEPATR